MVRRDTLSPNILALIVLALVASACNQNPGNTSNAQTESAAITNATSPSVAPASTSATTPTSNSVPDRSPASFPSPTSTPTAASTGNPKPVGTPKPAVTPKPLATPSPTATPVPVSGSSYPSCVSSDPNHLCIGLKIVSYINSSGVPVLSEADAITLVNGMNAIWSQCNISYQLELYQAVDPNNLGLPYSPDWSSETYDVRQQFQDRARFLVVAVGPWDVATIAVTTMPESGLYGTIVDQQYSHNPLTVGHEVGHYQGLYHVNDTSNLMSAYIGSNTKGLTTAQCSTSVNTDYSDWQLMLRKPN